MPSPGNSYTLTPHAQADLEDIWDYTVEHWSLDQAERYHVRIVTVFDTLAAEPHKGADVNHIRVGYRRWAVGRHFVFYRHGEDGVVIVRILHQRRDFRRHL